MAFSTSAALLALVALASSRNINVGNKCNSEADKTSIGRCVRPWLDLWELQRTRESAAADLVFPLVYYARESVSALCDLYTKSRDDCLTDQIIDTCSGDSMISFVQSHMKYLCDVRAVPALSRLECITKAVKSKPECRDHIRGIPLPNHQASKCLGMPQYFKCIEPEIGKRCGAAGLTVMIQAIDAFGCKFADPGSDKSGEVQVSLRKPAAAPSARPKLRSDVVKTLEQSNPKEKSISLFTDESDKEGKSSSDAPLTKSAKSEKSRGPGLVLMSSSADHQSTTPEPEEVVTVLRDLAPKRSTTRGPGLIMLPLDGQDHITSPSPSVASSTNIEGSGEEDESAGVNKSSAKAVVRGGLELIPEGSGEEDVGSGEEFLQVSSQLNATSSDSDPSHVNVTSTIGALEKKVTSTEAPAPTEKSVSPASAANSFCDAEKQTAIGNCFLPLSKRMEGIHTNFPNLSEVIFPLFNYTTTDLLGMCEVLQVTIDDCLSKELLISCSENDLVTFVNSLLGFACAKEHHADFFMNYDCINKVMQDSQECFALIPGRALPGIGASEKCANMPAFYNCMENRVAEKCSNDAVQTFLKAILNFGCSVGAEPKKSDKEKENDILPVVDDDRENKVVEAPVALSSESPTTAGQNSASSTIAVVATSPTTIKPSTQTAATAASNNVDEPSTSSGGVTLSPECTAVFRTKARSCVQPLMETWTKIRADKPQLTNITFPLYKYQREELLELCDGYANVFLCAGFDPIQKCLTDEMVRFANDHLGYICSPQNIVNFMRHYDCIMDLVGRSQTSCVPLISGKSEIGKDADKCKGVPAFYGCMKDSIKLNCRPTALQEFEGTISQFGCEFAS